MEMRNAAMLMVVVLMAGCNQKTERKYAGLQTLDWLEGRWESPADGGKISEIWKKANDSTFQGACYFTKNNGKDTVHLETIELIERAGTTSYNPTVEGQNNGLPVTFRMTSNTGKMVVFENPSHDYPQKISYILVNNDSLVAEISGRRSGKMSSEKFGMKKAE